MPERSLRHGDAGADASLEFRRIRHGCARLVPVDGLRIVSQPRLYALGPQVQQDKRLVARAGFKRCARRFKEFTGARCSRGAGITVSGACVRRH